MKRTSKENQLITLMVNAPFDVAMIYVAYSIHNIINAHPASDPMIKIMVYIMTGLVSLAMIAVAIREPEGAAFMTQHDEESIRLSSILSFLTVVGIIITMLLPAFTTVCLASLFVIAASVFFLIKIIKESGKDVKPNFKQVRATSRLFIWSKYVGIMVAEWAIVPIKMYALNFSHSNSVSSLNFLLTLGLYLIIAVINVNIIFNLFEKSRWYGYRYKVEENKEREFQSEVDEKAYDAVAEDYNWAFVRIAPIVAANTAALFFVML